MELDKEAWEYIRDILDKNAKIETQIYEIRQAYNNVKGLHLNRKTAESFVYAIGIILGEEE